MCHGKRYNDLHILPFLKLRNNPSCVHIRFSLSKSVTDRHLSWLHILVLWSGLTSFPLDNILNRGIDGSEVRSIFSFLRNLHAVHCMVVLICTPYFAVSAGVGTRNYYRKIGYRLQGPYMVKMLRWPPHLSLCTVPSVAEDREDFLSTQRKG